MLLDGAHTGVPTVFTPGSLCINPGGELHFVNTESLCNWTGTMISQDGSDVPKQPNATITNNGKIIIDYSQGSPVISGTLQLINKGTITCKITAGPYGGGVLSIPPNDIFPDFASVNSGSISF